MNHLGLELERLVKAATDAGAEICIRRGRLEIGGRIGDGLLRDLRRYERDIVRAATEPGGHCLRCHRCRRLMQCDGRCAV